VISFLHVFMRDHSVGQANDRPRHHLIGYRGVLSEFVSAK